MTDRRVIDPGHAIGKLDESGCGVDGGVVVVVVLVGASVCAKRELAVLVWAKGERKLLAVVRGERGGVGEREGK